LAKLHSRYFLRNPRALFIAQDLPKAAVKTWRLTLGPRFGEIRDIPQVVGSVVPGFRPNRPRAKKIVDNRGCRDYKFSQVNYFGDFAGFGGCSDWFGFGSKEVIDVHRLKVLFLWSRAERVETAVGLT